MIAAPAAGELPGAAAELAIAAGIDAERLQAVFAETGFVQICPFLPGDEAEALRRHLAEREDWTRTIKAAAADPFDCQLAQNRLSTAQLEALETLAAPGAGSGFRYVFDKIVAADRDGERHETGTLLARFAGLLARPATRDALGAICGEDIATVEAQATRYRPGHFLTMHHDSESGSRRRVAYIFGLTEGWRPEWGGLLLFHDEAGEIVRGFVPRMNTLTLFKLPRIHSVSLVAPSAGAMRYSVAGWLNVEAPAA